MSPLRPLMVSYLGQPCMEAGAECAYFGCAAAQPSGEPTADAELQQPAAAALANLCSGPALADQIVRDGGMDALCELAASPDREVQVTCSAVPPFCCSSSAGA